MRYPHSKFSATRPLRALSPIAADQPLKSIVPAARLAGQVTVESADEVLVVQNARVQLSGAHNKSVITDADGQYLFPIANEGNLTVTAHAQGFQPQSVPRTLRQGTDGNASFVLEDLPRGDGDRGQDCSDDVCNQDIDINGSINSVDVQLVINAALALPIAFAADVNRDGAVNSTDVQLVINAALGIGT